MIYSNNLFQELEFFGVDKWNIQKLIFLILLENRINDIFLNIQNINPLLFKANQQQDCSVNFSRLT